MLSIFTDSDVLYRIFLEDGAAELGFTNAFSFFLRQNAQKSSIAQIGCTVDAYLCHRKHPLTDL